MNKYLQGIYFNIFFLNNFPFHFILLYKKHFLFFCYKTIYVLSECIINKTTLYKKYLFLKQASGSENYHEFIACIGIETRMEIGILMRYRDSYRNRYKIWYRSITTYY